MRVFRETDGGIITSKFLANCVSNLLVASWRSDDSEKFCGELLFTRVDDDGAAYEYSGTKNKVVFKCSFNGGISYHTEVNIDTDGELSLRDAGVVVNDATYLNTLTDIIPSASGGGTEADFSKLEETEKYHIAMFSDMMNRVELCLDSDESLETLTTDERINRLKCGKKDNGILNLYFDYGRYLMISSSICGSLPANLQGKWNDSIMPPWGSDYHLNINLQMNYWMTEMCDMPECSDRLIHYIERLGEKGREAAKRLYGCRGIWFPLSTDAWAATTPEAYGYGVWIGAAPWLMQHLWWHYTYSGDKVFLKERAYPLFKAVAEFYEDYLTEDEYGVMQITPSQSPENRFKGGGNNPVSICTSSAMDIQLAYDALG